MELKEDSNESGEECLKKKVLKDDLKVDIPDVVIDRAHRIGPFKKDEKSSKSYQSIIVRFTTWRHRTLAYRARKNAKKVRVRLDLTRRRMKLLEKANTWLGDNDENFAFADINCRLCIRLEGEFHYFKDENALTEIIKYAWNLLG